MVLERGVGEGEGERDMVFEQEAEETRANHAGSHKASKDSSEGYLDDMTCQYIRCDMTCQDIRCQ